jgi:1,2-diacylglycerol 3-alpha-glucosyltransferase
MRIMMLTNTFPPTVGGVARSVASTAAALRQAGHDVVVVCPSSGRGDRREPGVVRIPALGRLNHGQFTVGMPPPGLLTRVADRFAPDVIHAHHPFLLGDTALRLAGRCEIPVVFTHHTMYERYTHYLPGDSATLRRMAAGLATHYANLCDRVVAPSASVATILRRRGVTTPIAVVPTGIDLNTFGNGDRRRGRRQYGITDQALVIGHVGRLAPEKDLHLLARATAATLRALPAAWLLVVGNGPVRDDLHRILGAAGVSDRVRLAEEALDQSGLADVYAAMDLFVFSSRSETQGLVLAEAMAAGVPVVAVDAPGVRDIVRDGENGLLVRSTNTLRFSQAMRTVLRCSPASRRLLRRGARRTARRFGLPRMATRLGWVYEGLRRTGSFRGHDQPAAWMTTIRRLAVEYRLFGEKAAALEAGLRPSWAKHRESWPAVESLRGRDR